MTPNERIAQSYRDSADTNQRARDAKIAAGFKESDHWERVEQVVAADREKVSATTRLGLGIYLEARAAAARVAAAGGAQ